LGVAKQAERGYSSYDSDLKDTLEPGE